MRQAALSVGGLKAHSEHGPDCTAMRWNHWATAGGPWPAAGFSACSAFAAQLSRSTGIDIHPSSHPSRFPSKEPILASFFHGAAKPASGTRSTTRGGGSCSSTAPQTPSTHAFFRLGVFQVPTNRWQIPGPDDDDAPWNLPPRRPPPSTPPWSASAGVQAENARFLMRARRPLKTTVGHACLLGLASSSSSTRRIVTDTSSQCLLRAFPVLQAPPPPPHYSSLAQ